MGLLTTSIVSVGLIALGLNSVTEAGIFNAVVPNLSSGWFAKPGPTESLVFGLMVLKVMALRMAGVFPYNLNDMWSRGGVLGDAFFKESTTARTKRDLFFAQLNKFSKAPLLKEIDAVERILLGLRRIDSHDCFIRHVCQIKQNQLTGQGSEYESTILSIFRYGLGNDTYWENLKPRREAANSGTSIWDIYHDALTPKVIDCDQKYKLCPLTKKETSAESLLSGLF